MRGPKTASTTSSSTMALPMMASGSRTNARSAERHPSADDLFPGRLRDGHQASRMRGSSHAWSDVDDQVDDEVEGGAEEGDAHDRRVVDVEDAT